MTRMETRPLGWSGIAMKGRRDRFIVATKSGWLGFNGATGRSAYDMVASLVAGVENNLPPGVPLENLKAACQACIEWGAYEDQ